MSSISTETCVRAFISSWVSRFRVPATLTSDRGAQFTSSVWAGVCRVLGISTSQTTSFHPQSNGMIERFHRSLKSSLRARAADSDWVSYLPLVLFSSQGGHWFLRLRGSVRFCSDDSGRVLRSPRNSKFSIHQQNRESNFQLLRPIVFKICLQPRFLLLSRLPSLCLLERMPANLRSALCINVLIWLWNCGVNSSASRLVPR